MSRVAGVAEVAGLNLFERAQIDGESTWRLLTRTTVDGAQQRDLAPWQLPELPSVLVVEVGAGAAGGTGGINAAPESLAALPNPFADETAVAVPVVPEVC